MLSYLFTAIHSVAPEHITTAVIGSRMANVTQVFKQAVDVTMDIFTVPSKYAVWASLLNSVIAAYKSQFGAAATVEDWASTIHLSITEEL